MHICFILWQIYHDINLCDKLIKSEKENDFNAKLDFCFNF